MVFVVAARHTIHSGLYMKSHHFNPVIYSYKVVNIGRSSFQQILQAKSSTTNEILNEDVVFTVIVDKNRKPVPFPPELEEIVSAYKSEDVHVDRVKAAEKTEKACVIKRIQNGATQTSTFILTRLSILSMYMMQRQI